MGADRIRNLRGLNERFKLGMINDLIDRKLAGQEKMKLATEELALHKPHFDRLCRELDAAREASPLPDEPASRAALNDLLLRVRLKYGDSASILPAATNS